LTAPQEPTFAGHDQEPESWACNNPAVRQWFWYKVQGWEITPNHRFAVFGAGDRFGSTEEYVALLDAEADWLCNAREHGSAPRYSGGGTTDGSCRPRPVRFG